jgi:hypothetical protein
MSDEILECEQTFEIRNAEHAMVNLQFWAWRPNFGDLQELLNPVGSYTARVLHFHPRASSDSRWSFRSLERVEYADDLEASTPDWGMV